MRKTIIVSNSRKEDRTHKSTQQYTCPICGRRLFDVEPESIGVIEIKCSRCRQVISVTVDTIHLAGPTTITS